MMVMSRITAASYAPKVGNCELRITEKRFVKVLKCLVQNTPKSKVLWQIELYYSHQILIYILILTNDSLDSLRALKLSKNAI
jgi:hypothetical protein